MVRWQAHCGALSLQVKAMDDLMAVVRIVMGLETQRPGQVAHGSIACGVYRIHLAKAVFTGCLDQVVHQYFAQAQVRPFIGDRDCTFALMLASGRVAADADLDQFAVVMDQGDIGQAAMIVRVHQLIEHRSAGFVDLRKKTHMTGLGRQSFDEGVFTVAILLRQWPDQNVATIPERFDPVLAVDCSIGGRSPIIVVFDGKHGVFLLCEWELERSKRTALDFFVRHC
ncbi:hypothetical protein EMIT0194P_120122 [Pseudomonas serbica]